MRLARRTEAQSIDQSTTTDLGVSAELLMESAGALMADAVMALLERLPIKRPSVTIFCGPGHNGGDGLVIARHLFAQAQKVRVTVCLTSDPQDQDSLNQKQLERLRAFGLNLQFYHEMSEAQKQRVFETSDLLIDALFGVGLSRPIEGEYAELIRKMNGARGYRMSVDVASGINADTGAVLGVAVCADQTLCVLPTKRGQWVGEGASHSGELIPIEVGFSRHTVRRLAQTTALFHETYAKRYLPKRSPAGNKSTYGKLFVAAGHPGTLGAGLLTARAALRMGAGYVCITNENPEDIVKAEPELISKPMDEIDFGKDFPFAAVVAGPGFGKGKKQREFLKALRQSDIKNVLLDADALTLVQEEDLLPLPQEWLITPHAGELSRLIGLSAKEIEGDRFHAAEAAREKLGAMILLKGHRTVIQAERAYVIESGNAALAKAGTGDVLSGFIGGLMAQNQKVLVSALTATYLHGRLADDWIRDGQAAASLTPTDLIEGLAPLMSELEGD